LKIFEILWPLSEGFGARRAPFFDGFVKMLIGDLNCSQPKLIILTFVRDLVVVTYDFLCFGNAEFVCKKLTWAWEC
jgi:hypothetical protein